jgi:protein phosphatase
MKFRVGTLSITGNFRENNEDNFYTDPQHRFFLVADGMGGQSAGERASAIAMELIPKRLKVIDFEKGSASAVEQLIDDAISHANAEIMALGELDSQFKNMGTTITFLVAVGNTLYCGGVGDSRVYRLRDQKLEQLTTDHSLTQALVDAGTLTLEEAANHRFKNVLYRYLGSKDGGGATKPRQLDAKPGDRFVLCTDGVNGGLSDENLAKLLATGSDPQKIADSIVRGAEQGGSRDNITCTVVIVE